MMGKQLFIDINYFEKIYKQIKTGHQMSPDGSPFGKIQAIRKMIDQ